MSASRHRVVFAAALCVFAFFTGSASAKRTVPRAVEPVTVHGVTYSAPATAMGFVVASDASSGRELWRQRIYRISVNPSLERDVQDVFITSLTLRGGSPLSRTSTKNVTPSTYPPAKSLVKATATLNHARKDGRFAPP
jgi:hypothetical protein